MVVKGCDSGGWACVHAQEHDSLQAGHTLATPPPPPPHTCRAQRGQPVGSCKHAFHPAPRAAQAIGHAVASALCEGCVRGACACMGVEGGEMGEETARAGARVGLRSTPHTPRTRKHSPDAAAAAAAAAASVSSAAAASSRLYRVRGGWGGTRQSGDPTCACTCSQYLHGWVGAWVGGWVGG